MSDHKRSQHPASATIPDTDHTVIGTLLGIPIISVLVSSDMLFGGQ
jgi:hypothetical protein